MGKIFVNYGSNQFLRDNCYYCNQHFMQNSKVLCSHEEDRVCGICCAFLTN